MECSKSVLQALRNEYASVGINLNGVSDKELQKQIKDNVEEFKAVGYGSEVCGSMDQLAEEYRKARKNK